MSIEDAELFDERAVSKITSLPLSCLRKWRMTGADNRGPIFCKIGKRVAYPASALREWLDQRTVDALAGRR